MVLYVTNKDVLGRIRSGTSLGRMQDVKLMSFYGVFSTFSGSIGISDIMDCQNILKS